MFYTVNAGDTMQAIAGRFNVTLARLIAANPQIKDPNPLTLGEIILIPSATWFPVVPIPTPASS
jgi:morphogenetic protein associated with SpoVID